MYTKKEAYLFEEGRVGIKMLFVRKNYIDWLSRIYANNDDVGEDNKSVVEWVRNAEGGEFVELNARFLRLFVHRKRERS